MLNIKLTENIMKDTDLLLSELIKGCRPTINDVYDTTIDTTAIDRYRDNYMNYMGYSMERTMAVHLNCPPSDVKQQLSDQIKRYMLNNWDKQEATYTVTVISAIRHILDKGTWCVGSWDRTRTQFILEWFILQFEEFLDIYVELL